MKFKFLNYFKLLLLFIIAILFFLALTKGENVVNKLFNLNR